MLSCLARQSRRGSSTLAICGLPPTKASPSRVLTFRPLNEIGGSSTSSTSPPATRLTVGKPQSQLTQCRTAFFRQPGRRWNGASPRSTIPARLAARWSASMAVTGAGASAIVAWWRGSRMSGSRCWWWGWRSDGRSIGEGRNLVHCHRNPQSSIRRECADRWGGQISAQLTCWNERILTRFVALCRLKPQFGSNLSARH